MPAKADRTCCVWKQWVNFFAYLLLLFVTVLGASLRFDNTSVPEMVDVYKPVFWTAGYANVIFGILTLLGLLGFVTHQFMATTKHDKYIHNANVPFWFLASFGVIWTFAFYYDVQWLAFVAAIAYTITAFIIYVLLGIGVDRVSNRTYWFVFFPFTLIAAGALFYMLGQFNVFCQAYGWTWWGMTESEWALVGMLALTFAASYIMARRSDVIFGAAMVWWSASVAVYQEVASDNHSIIVTCTAIAMALYFAYVTYSSAIHMPRKVQSLK